MQPPVEFGGVPAVNFTALSDIEIVATVPVGAINGPISVRSPAGTGSSAAAFNLVTSPANDLFVDSALIQGTSDEVSGSNGGAGKEPGEPDHAGNAGARSVWFAWLAPASGTWTFDTFGSDFDTLLAVYTGGSIQALELVAANDDAPDRPGNSSKVAFAAVAGTTYHLAIDGYGGLQGLFDLSWELTPNVPAITGFSLERHSWRDGGDHRAESVECHGCGVRRSECHRLRRRFSDANHRPRAPRREFRPIAG